jgi:hypothetical protein
MQRYLSGPVAQVVVRRPLDQKDRGSNPCKDTLALFLRRQYKFPQYGINKGVIIGSIDFLSFLSLQVEVEVSFMHRCREYSDFNVSTCYNVVQIRESKELT